MIESEISKMKLVRILLLAGLVKIPVFSGAALSAEPELGSMNEDGRYHLFRENVEDIYFNDWSGLRVSNKRFDQADVYISGSGKTVSFDGVLSINCSNASGYFWKTGTFGGEPATQFQYNETMPLQVVVNARRLFCH